MKTVFDNNMVAHVWANQGQASARSNNGQFFFDGRAIYSYGRHFVAGYIMPDGTALVTKDRYSATTAKHVYLVRGAVSHRKKYHVPRLTELVHSYPLSVLRRSDKEYARIAVRRHVTENALEYDDDAALYLLGLVGIARSWAKIRRDAERARDAKRNAAVKKEIREILALNDSEFTDRISKRNTAGNARNYAKYLFYLHKNAKRIHGDRIQKTLYKRLEQAQEWARRLERRENLSPALKRYVKSKKAARELWAKRQTGALGRQDNLALSKHLQDIAKTRPGLLSKAAIERLESIITQCNETEKAFQAQEVADWISGKTPQYSGIDLDDGQHGALLRVVDVARDESGAIIGGDLQTSQGAKVPLTHALKAFAFVRRVVESGKAWHTNGHTIRVGHFRVSEIGADGRVRAGCHRINYEEMQRLASVLGVADIEPSDSALEPSAGAA